MDESELAGLQELAGLFGVSAQFTDDAGRLRVADAATLRGVLRTLGAAVEEAGVEEATRLRRRELASRPIEPVTVAWDGQPMTVAIRHRRSSSPSLECALVLEDGGRIEWSASPDQTDAGEGLVSRTVDVPGSLPIGYHRLTVRVGTDEFSGLIIAASTRAFEGPIGRSWGIFCPIYALHRQSSWGAGDLSDFEALIRWTSRLGGGLVATLPMLSTCFSESSAVSPYSPASRLFGNEFYLDPRRIPAFAESEPARAMVATDEFQAEIEHLRAEPLVHV